MRGKLVTVIPADIGLSTVKLYVQWIVAGIVAFWHGLPSLTQLLLALMMVDIVFGLIIAVRNHDLSVGTAFAGVTKKVGVLLMVGVAALLNPHVQGLMEINLVQAVSIFYSVPELTSIFRNAASLDIPVATEFKTILRYFQSRNGDKS